MPKILILVALFSTIGHVSAQDAKPHKYALLVAVREYEHPEINEPKLVFPEEDAKAFRSLLKESGYEVDVLLGKEATQDMIRKMLMHFGEKGGNKGVVMVGLFGHGIEFSSSKKSYFFPYDTPLKAVRDSNGRVQLRDDGQPKMEPDDRKMIAIDDVLIALKESKATNRVLVADCCRDDPNAARGRSFGTSLEINQLPKNTAVLFACSAEQKAHEHKDWGHGALTKCLLEAIDDHRGRGKPLMGRISEDVAPAVEKLVASKTREEQTPRFLSTGAVVDLQLQIPPIPKKPSMTPVDRKEFDGVIASYKGKVVLVHVWATWCPPCMKLLPKIEEFRRQHRDEVIVISLCVDDLVKGKAPDKAVSALKLSGSHDLISKLDISDDGAAAFNIENGGSIPHFKVYDRSGKLAKEFQNGPDYDLKWDSVAEFVVGTFNSTN